jgi:hypothetical protein
MKVHLRQIPQGGTLHLEGAEDPVSLGLEEIGARPESPSNIRWTSAFPAAGSLPPANSTFASD